MIKIPKNTDITPLIVTLTKLYHPHTYMELGTKRGYTFNQIAPLVPRAVAVDQDGESLRKYITDLPHVERYHNTTDQLADMWSDPIDMLFIDANHEWGQVLKDVNQFLPFLKVGTGLMLLHDTYPIHYELEAPGYCHNAWVAAHLLRTLMARVLEIVTLPGPYFGLSIIRKIDRDKHFDSTR